MAKRRSTEDKRGQKRQALIERTALILNVPPEIAEKRLSTPLVQAVRVNSLKGAIDETVREMRTLGWVGERHDWCDDGFTIESGYELLRDSQLVTDGKIYIQNPSSWLPVVALNPQAGERILDVCAAPGGKSSHVAAMQNNQGNLVLNDNSRTRLAKLQANTKRLGVAAEYTLYDATRLTKYLDAESFDKILLDAPCSGEGLINLATPKSLDTWSVAHIRRLADLQKKLITQAWQLLKPGGMLVYSTCTMAPEEDEIVIEYLLRRHDDAQVQPMSFTLENTVTQWNNRSLNPETQKAGRVFPANGSEAFFVCKLTKQLL